MARLTTGAFQATGKKMEGAGNNSSNFSKKPKIAAVKASNPLGNSAMPREVGLGTRGVTMKQTNVGGIARSYPSQVNAGVHAVLPHKVNE